MGQKDPLEYLKLIEVPKLGQTKSASILQSQFFSMSLPREEVYQPCLKPTTLGTLNAKGKVWQFCLGHEGDYNSGECRVNVSYDSVLHK